MLTAPSGPRGDTDQWADLFGTGRALSGYRVNWGGETTGSRQVASRMAGPPPARFREVQIPGVRKKRTENLTRG